MNFSSFLAIALLVLEKIRNPQQIGLDIYDPNNVPKVAEAFVKDVERFHQNDMMAPMLKSSHAEQTKAIHGVANKYCTFLVDNPTLVSKQIDQMIKIFKSSDQKGRDAYIKGLSLNKSKHEKATIKRLITLADEGLDEIKRQAPIAQKEAEAKLKQLDPNSKRKNNIREAIYNTAFSDALTRIQNGTIKKLTDKFIGDEKAEAQHCHDIFYNTVLHGFHLDRESESETLTQKAAKEPANQQQEKHFEEKPSKHPTVTEQSSELNNNSKKGNSEPSGSTRNSW